MAKKEAEVHGIRIKETRADRTFNVLNLIFWMIVLFITLYPPVAGADCVRLRPGCSAGG